MTSKPISVVIADDQWMIREGISALAELDDRISVVGLAANGRECIELVEDHNPDVVLMDIRMPVLDGIEATRRLSVTNPETKVVMLTTFEDQGLIKDSMAAGASGYLTKDIDAEDLAQAVRSAAAGIVQLTPTAIANVLDPAGAQSARPTNDDLDRLTAREFDVLRLIAEGATNRDIAEQLHISPGTAKNHVANVLRQLGLKDRTSAAVYAIRHGVV